MKVSRVLLYFSYAAMATSFSLMSTLKPSPANDVTRTFADSRESFSSDLYPNSSTHTRAWERCWNLTNSSWGDPSARLALSYVACQPYMNVCMSLSENMARLQCLTHSVTDFTHSNEVGECLSMIESQRKNATLDDCLVYVSESEKLGIALNESLVSCGPCKSHYQGNQSLRANLAYWRCAVHNKTLLSLNKTTNRASLAYSPCYEFLDFTTEELNELCLDFVNETLAANKSLTRVAINNSVCERIYTKTASLQVNVQYWQCQLFLKTLKATNVRYNSIFLLNTICKPFVALTASERSLLLIQCYTFINNTLSGNVTFANESFLNRTTVEASPCVHVYVTAWSLDRNNLYWQCALFERIRRNNNASVKATRYEMRRNACRTFLTLTAAELDEECVDAMRSITSRGQEVTAEFINQTICAKAYRASLTFSRNVLWWTCLTWVEDQQNAGATLSRDDLLKSVCKTFVTSPPRPKSTPLPQSAELFAYIANIFVIVTGTTGNGFVIYVLLVRQRKLRPGDGFTVFLAMNDFMASICTPVVILKLVIDRSVFNWGIGACKILHGLNATFLHASSWTLVVIAAERTRAIVFPFKPPLSGRSIALTGLCIYCISCAFSAPKVYHQKLYRHPLNYTLCNDVYANKSALMLVRLCLVATILLLPIAIMTVLYWLSIHNLVRQQRVYKANRERSASDIDQESQQLRLRRDMKVTVMFITVVVVFLTLVAPYWILSTVIAVLQAYDEGAFFRHYRLMNQFMYFLPSVYCLNSCANPFIYAGMHPEVRGTVSQLMATICCDMTALRRLSSAAGSRLTHLSKARRTRKETNEMDAITPPTHSVTTARRSPYEKDLPMPSRLRLKAQDSPNSDASSTRRLTSPSNGSPTSTNMQASNRTTMVRKTDGCHSIRGHDNTAYDS